MPTQHGVVSASSARIEALKIKHKTLSHKIELELNRPSFSDAELSALKREKLKIKEQIEGIRQAS